MIQKQRRHQSKKLRDSAKSQPCMIRLNGVCNGDASTTVLAHLNGGGMGTKKSDMLAAFACSDCHDVVDRRVKHGFSPAYVKLAHYEGVERTQQYWLDNGDITL